MGIETDEPLVSEAAYQGGFKNTGGIARRKIIYRDFSAFWLINELRALKAGGRGNIPLMSFTASRKKLNR